MKKTVALGKGISVYSIIDKMRQGYIEMQKQAQKSLEGAGAFGPPYLPYPFLGTPQQPVEINIHAEKVEEVREQGMEIPLKYMPLLAAPSKTAEELEELRGIKRQYNLIPSAPTKGELVFAYASIVWSDELGELIYTVHEPRITKYDIEVIEKAKHDLEERLDVDFTKLGDIKVKELLVEEIKKSMASVEDMNIDEAKKAVISYYIQKEILGFGKIEPLMRDENIEDISCDGVGIPIYVYHRDPKIGSLKTNLVFETEDELNSFMLKLAQKCNKSISIAEPLLDGALPDGSRIQATLGTDIARRGSNFTVRKFMSKPLTPTHMIKYNTMDATQLAYMWLAIENGQSILISGGTATGKTSLLNALSLFIRPNLKIVSIEDTAELRLPHPHWIPEVARTPLSIEGRIGEVSLFDLLKSSLRQRPDYIVLGEVRGKEAFVLFQQMASVPGNEHVLVYNGSRLKSLPIAELEGKTYNLPTMDAETGAMLVRPMKILMQHLPVPEMFRITTSTGREVVATGNHSVFTYNGKIEPVVVSEMKEGTNILIPARLQSVIGGKNKRIGKSARKLKTVGDIYVDKVKEIERIQLDKPEPVFDIMVPDTQNFIGGSGGGVMLHNTGHPSLATIHAASITQLIDRLITPPISLPPSLLENINIIIFLVLSKLHGSYVRRTESILEVVGLKGDRPLTRKIFEWKPLDDSFITAEKSTLLSSITTRQGVTEDTIKNELMKRKKILEWMFRQGIYDYREVVRIISTYYSNPDKVMEAIEYA